MNEDDFLAKVEWEGGVLDALEYGLKASDLAEADSELGRLWKGLEKAWKRFQPVLGAVEDYIEDYEDEKWVSADA